MTSNTEQPDRSGVDEIADGFVADYAAADPIEATEVGIAGYDDKLTDLTADGFAAREHLIRRARDAMGRAEPADERERIAKEAFLERLGVQLDQYEAGAPQTRISVLTSQLHAIREAFDLMDTGSEEGWRNIDARLAAIAATLAGYRTTLLDGAQHGRVSAKRQIAAVVDQVNAWTGQQGEGGDFFAELVQPADVPDSLKKDLQQHATQARDAYAAFAEFLHTEVLPLARERDAVGREQYARDSRYFLGATVDLDETYAWGWQELDRIERDMADVSRQIVGADATGLDGKDLIDAAVERLDRDPGRTIKGRDAFRDWMQQLADTTITELADVHFDIPEPVRRIECCLAPTNDGGIYYTGPSEDFTRPGRMWWAVPDGIDDFSTWREVTTVYHEGVPGHHLQVGQTAYRSELLNRWQRTMCWVSGHGEGWALYAERLMDDLGYLADPGAKLGMLDGQGFRAARVIVDIGMHLELEIPQDNPFGFHPGETWTPELGLEFLRQHCRMEDAVIRFELNRYLGWPGQAPSYKVGERIWLQARDEVRRRKGADFDLKAFHRAALDLGALGLDPLYDSLTRL